MLEHPPRARELGRNNSYVKRYFRLLVTNVIGPMGIKLQAQVRAGDQPDTKTNAAIEAAWNDWANSPVTVDGRLTLRRFEKLILKTVACFRLILPRQQILVAGGRAVNLRDAQSLVFAAGASALMVGNYLTTLNRPVEEDLQMLRDLGLEPDFGPPSPDREQAAVPRAAG